MDTRRCSKCRAVKPLDEFFKGQYYCKPCMRAYQRSEPVRAANRSWRAANRGKHAASVRTWNGANPERHRELVRASRQSRRARKRAAFVEHVDLKKVIERDGENCGICGEPVPVGERSLDHVLPLARGGRHEYANVQLAHRACNVRKGARMTTI